MKYVFLNYNYSPDFNSPASWFKRTEVYAGIMECLSQGNTVINVKQINYEGDCVHNGIQYRFRDFGKKKTYFPRQQHQYVKNLNPDVVVVQGLHNPLQVIQLGLILNKKTRIIAHHHAEKPFNGIKKYIQKLADKFVDAYLFASKPMGLDWVNRGNLSSSKKIHEVMEVSSLFHPVNRAAAKSKTGVSNGTVFLWVGRLNANKDPLNVIQAFLKFTVIDPAARLYMIYHTDELIDEIKELLGKNGAANKVILIGKVAHNELLYWFNSADFFLSGSHYEGSGTAVCEAMSCGCIPVVTDIFSFRMITDNGNCGILYEAGNQDALLSALIQTQQININEKRERSLAFFKSTLSFQAIAQRIQKIAEALITE
jgi:glycosyltransferase involved in cell wall biosynthesis